jgi:hypothetical protein
MRRRGFRRASRPTAAVRPDVFAAPPRVSASGSLYVAAARRERLLPRWPVQRFGFALNVIVRLAAVPADCVVVSLTLSVW